MTLHKHFKQLVRTRIQKTGESYSTARRQLLHQPESAPKNTRFPWHLPGSVPATTGLRILLKAAGVTAPHTGQPFSEPMLFGIAGGIGAGMFAFHYPQFSSFYVAGRHLWHDDLAYLQAACERLGAKTQIKESSGVKTAEKQLRDALQRGQPVLAWVDLTLLPHRVTPKDWEGSGYHMVPVHEIDDQEGVVWISDMLDDPVPVPLPAFAKSRDRIKKQKNRLLWIESVKPLPDLEPLVRQGIQACCQGLTQARMKNFTLESFKVWAERLHGNKSKEGWEYIFPRGKRLWWGLVFMYDFIEYYGSGGGKMRPLFAAFFEEAYQALKQPLWKELAHRYAELGRSWSELAHCALPDRVPLLKETRDLYDRKAEAFHSGAPREEVQQLWKQIGKCEERAEQDFPLSEAECADLRLDLQKRVTAIYEQEMAALAMLPSAVK